MYSEVFNVQHCYASAQRKAFEMGNLWTLPSKILLNDVKHPMEDGQATKL